MITAADVVKGATIWVPYPGWIPGSVEKTTIRARYGSDEVITDGCGRFRLSDMWLTRSDALLGLAIRAEDRAKAARLEAEKEDQLAAKLKQLAREA